MESASCTVDLIRVETYSNYTDFRCNISFVAYSYCFEEILIFEDNLFCTFSLRMFLVPTTKRY
jgi:hypothetical protein